MRHASSDGAAFHSIIGSRRAAVAQSNVTLRFDPLRYCWDRLLFVFVQRAFISVHSLTLLNTES